MKLFICRHSQTDCAALFWTTSGGCYYASLLDLHLKSYCRIEIAIAKMVPNFHIVTKGHLNSKCPFGVFKSPKKNSKISSLASKNK